MPTTAAPESANASQPQHRAAIATLRDLIIIAVYYRKMVACVLAAGLILSVVAFFLSPVRYTARLQLMLLGVTESTGALGLSTGNAAVDTARAASSESEFLRNRAFLTKVAETLGPATVDPTIGERRWLGIRPARPEEDQLIYAVDFIERWLKITTPLDTNLIQVSFQHKDRKTAIAVVDTLADLYLQRRREIYTNLKSPFLLDKAKAYGRQLETIEEAIRNEKINSNVLNLDQEITMAVEQVATIKAKQAEALEHEAALTAEITASQSRLLVTKPLVFDYIDKSDRAENDETDNMLLKLHVQRDHLLQLYQDDDPGIADIDHQIGLLEESKKRPRREFTDSREVRNPALDYLNLHLTQLQVEAEAARESARELSTQLDLAQQRVDQLRDAENKLRGLERSRTVTDTLYRDFTQRADAAQSEEAAAEAKNANIRIVAEGEASLRGETGRVNLALAILIASAVVAMASALLADWNRQVFLLPQEVETTLNLPVLAIFNEGQKIVGQNMAQPVIHLAGQLVFNRPAGGGMQTLQILSQDNQEHREEFALALAIELAAGHTMRTLLLDLTGDGDTQWRTLGQPQSGDNLSGLKVAHTEVAHLDVSVGATRSEINWLRVNKAVLDDLLKTLSKYYDMIVINAPPFRDGAIPIRLANVVDGSILVLKAEHTRRSVINVLMTQLLGSGGDMFGAVVTGRKFYIPRIIYRWL